MTHTAIAYRYFLGSDKRVVFNYNEAGELIGYELYPADSEEYAALLSDFEPLPDFDDDWSE